MGHQINHNKCNYFAALELKFIKSIRFILVTVFILLGFLLFAQVVMRYGIESPFLGTEELAPMLALWGYFLGMVNATREREHITGGVLTLICKNIKIIQVVRIFGTLICLIATIIFGYYAWDFALFNLDIGRKSLYMRWPKYLWDFSMVTGFVLIGFYYVIQLVSEVKQFRKTKLN
jgi:TRAP-type C4-dicarboxylate transport system permease small subunit